MQELIKARGCYETRDLRQAEECYRRVLEADPHHGEALHRLGLMAMQEGKPAVAADYLQRAATASPADAVVQNHLGVALAGSHRLEDAAECFERAVKSNPRDADALYNLGNALRMLGRLDDAVGRYRTAAVLAPQAPEIPFNLANALRDLGRLNEAVAAYQQAVRIRPQYLKAYNNLGNVLRDQGKLAAAAEAFRMAIQFNPGYAEAHHNLGLALYGQDLHELAMEQFREALRLKPELVAARNSLAKALTERGLLDEAVPLLQAAQAQGQSTAETQLALAEKLRQAGRYDEAIACLEKVLESKADLAAAHNNLGLVWAAKSDFSKAIACYRQAVQIKPDFAEAYNNLAVAQLTLCDSERGMDAIETALRVKPDFAVAHLNRAVTWLRLGNFRQGWPEFEWRRLCEPYRTAPLPAPLWDGAAVPNRSVLLHAEQGLGDTIQLIRFAPLVKERCGTVILQCQKSLAPLLARCAGVDRLVVRGDVLPQYHLQSPLMSLPAILRTSLDTIPAEVPYVFADAALTQAWRERLAGYGGFKIGIAWQGNPKYAADSLRSIPLRHFLPLAGLPGVKLFSLQKGPGAEQLAARESHGIVAFGTEFDGAAGAFMDTAAVMRNLDLVITSDTAVAHLAGALGVPVWVALGRSCDWRWLEDRADCPWYPTMRLFRQARLGDWEGVFAAIAAELARLVRGEPATPLTSPPHEGLAPALLAPLSVGELLDRITILKVKQRKIAGAAACRNVERELRELSAVQRQVVRCGPPLDALVRGLQEVNEALWEIEDEIRTCEARGDFGPRFVELARAVYESNDRRAAIKRRINEASGSAIVEEKLYRAEKGPAARRTAS